MPICKTCQLDKPEEEFYWHTGNNKRRKECKKCSNVNSARGHAANPKASTARHQKYKDSHREQIEEYRKKFYKENRFQLALLGSMRSARDRARAKGLAFDLDSAYMHTLGNVCSLTGLGFRNPEVSGVVGPYSISLDRMKPELGYIKGNVRLILHSLNAAKGSGTDADLLAICKALIEHNKARNDFPTGC